MQRLQLVNNQLTQNPTGNKQDSLSVVDNRTGNFRSPIKTKFYI